MAGRLTTGLFINPLANLPEFTLSLLLPACMYFLEAGGT